nr:MAG TPA: hypothetical protein [Caudoviricetes sp.]
MPVSGSHVYAEVIMGDFLLLIVLLFVGLALFDVITR